MVVEWLGDLGQPHGAVDVVPRWQVSGPRMPDANTTNESSEASPPKSQKTSGSHGAPTDTSVRSATNPLPPRKGSGRKKYSTGGSSLDQLKGITDAQKKVRKGKLKDKKIDSIEKSKKAVKNALDRVKNQDDANAQFP